jgi:hypothetical protein
MHDDCYKHNKIEAAETEPPHTMHDDEKPSIHEISNAQYLNQYHIDKVQQGLMA